MLAAIAEVLLEGRVEPVGRAAPGPRSSRARGPAGPRARRATRASRATGAAPAARSARGRRGSGRSGTGRAPGGRASPRSPRPAPCPRSPCAGSITCAVASYSEKSMWSPRPDSSRFQYATSAAHAACIAVTCSAMSPGRHQRLAAGQAGPAEHAAHRQQRPVGRHPVAVGPGLAEVGDRQHDQAGVPRADDVGAEPSSAARRAGRLDPDVGAVQQAQQPLATVRGRRGRRRRRACPRCAVAKRRLTPSCSGACARDAAPPGGSTRMTSAPRSARKRPHISPLPSAMSITRTPSSGVGRDAQHVQSP